MNGTFKTILSKKNKIVKILMFCQIAMTTISALNFIDNKIHLENKVNINI